MYLKSLLAALSFLATPLAAQSFDVLLGKTPLGSLTYSAKGSDAQLGTRLDNTPFGVFNGTFSGTSVKTGDMQRFTGISASSRKSLKVVVDIASGRAVATKVEPKKELTPLSDPERVAAGVMDPVQAIKHLIAARQGCPTGIRIYDGRRAIALSPEKSNTQDGVLTCTVSYDVIAGPGHLSPLRIKHADMLLQYDVSGDRQILSEIQMGSSIFKLRLKRRD